MRAKLTFKNGVEIVGDFRDSDGKVVSFKPEGDGCILQLFDRNDVESIKKVVDAPVKKRRLKK